MLGIASGLSSDDIDNLIGLLQSAKIKPSYAQTLNLQRQGK